MTDSFEALARDEADVKTARVAIWRALDTESGHRTAYAVLCRWTWRIMIERRLDDELRSWHRLLLDTAGRIAMQASEEAKPHARARLDRSAAAERIRALADLVRMSVEAACASVLKELVARAHVSEILRLLAKDLGTSIEREQIKNELALRDANLSRVLTLLAANGLVERLPRGKAAAFRITQRGLALLDTSHRERNHLDVDAPPPPAPTPIPVKQDSVNSKYEPFKVLIITAGRAEGTVRGGRFGPQEDVYCRHEGNAFYRSDRSGADQSKHRREKELVH